MSTMEKSKSMSETMISGMNQANLPPKWHRKPTRKKKRKSKTCKHLSPGSVQMLLNQNKQHPEKNCWTVLHWMILNPHPGDIHILHSHQNVKSEMTYCRLRD